MKRIKRHLRSILVTVSLLGLLAAVASITATGAGKFGEKGDLALAKAIWKEMKNANLRGSNAILGVPYKGQEPHGMILETLTSRMTVNGMTGKVIVKKNYGGKGVSPGKVAGSRAKWLKAVTVMFQRPKGYDNDNNNWFWVKFLPNGSLDKAPNGKQLAGQNPGCIACHKGAGPGRVFTEQASFLDK